jgi:protection-of-telomeres protein 1
MDITPNSSLGEIPLPDGFSTIEQIANIPNDRLRMKPKVNVIGFIKDFQAPMRTRGTGLWYVQVYWLHY